MLGFFCLFVFVFVFLFVCLFVCFLFLFFLGGVGFLGFFGFLVCLFFAAFTRRGHECQNLLRPCDGIHMCTD